jgi:hypothetical protein
VTSSTNGEEGGLLGIEVSEIHAYPLRPEGFEEPLFSKSRRAVAEHFLRTPWLSRASEMEGKGGQAVHVRRESVEVENRCGRVLRASGERRVVEVLDRWREVSAWWDEARAADRTVVRVLLSDGAVVDLAREGSGWFLVGVAD